jgi:hypothetical protein
MKKHAKAPRTHTAVLTPRELAATRGGHNGTIVVENALADTRGISGGALPRGIQGSGHG